MRNDELNNSYFKWLCQLVSNDECSSSYQKLLIQLHSLEFDYSIPMDGNRADDGTNLRYRYGYETGRRDSEIASCLDNRPCSVLDMMCALALRCEEDIMQDPDKGIRAGRWFWRMIDNLKLSEMKDRNFDVRYVRDRIAILLERRYAQNGDGGLFTVNHCQHDMRGVDIWYQMQYYLNEVIEKGDAAMC